MSNSGVNSNRRRALRTRLSEAQNHRCCYCGCKMLDDTMHPKGITLEHVQAVVHGGRTNFSNCVVACQSCNVRRGHQNARAFFATIQTGGARA